VPEPYKFLVVGDNPDELRSTTRALFVRFPKAIVRQCVGSSAALVGVADQNHAVIVQQSIVIESLAVTQLLRKADDAVPIIVLSQHDCTREAAAFGATRYLPKNQSERIANVVVEVLSAAEPRVHRST
jgi:hypothetical protein